MELPNLLNKFTNTSEEVKKFVAIEISLYAVKTSIWQSTGAHTEVVSLGSIQEVDPAKSSDLITAIDTSLMEAQATVAEEPDQVIFGLPESWVEDEGIVEDKKTILKNVCQKLGFKAIGYVVSAEAIIHHLRDIEGGPPSAIMIRISPQLAVVNLAYLGKLESSYTVKRSSSFATDIEEAIARLPHNGHLPSRMIIIADNDESETLKQELISFDWQKRLQFLHIPKVESLPKDWSIKAISIAGGSEVVESLGFGNLTKTELPVVHPPPKRPANFGFDTVVLNEEQPEEIPEEIPEEQPEEIPEEPVIVPDYITGPQVAALESEVEPDIPVIQPTALGIKGLIKNNPISRFKMKPFNRKILLPGIVAIIISALLIGLYLVYAALPAATIDVSVTLNSFQHQLEFRVDPTAAETDLATLTIAGNKQSVEQTGSKTIPATGTKTVGERAKGKVTIYNRTSAAKTFKAGDALKANNLQFTFDTSVTVASASTKENADFSLTTEPSRAEVLITAADIGDQYNLTQNTQFSVANYSPDSFVAVANAALTGGSARKVSAVAKEDVAQIKTDLILELQSTITQAIAEDPASGIKQLAVGDPEIITEDYSAKAGEEASELTLNLTMTQTVYTYDVNELTWLAQQSAQNTLPENVQIKPDTTKVDIIESTVSDKDVAIIKSNITIQYIPQIDSSQYRQVLTNTSLADVDAKLRQIPNYHSYSLTSSKGLFFKRLPLKSDQIVVHIIPVSQ